MWLDIQCKTKQGCNRYQMYFVIKAEHAGPHFHDFDSKLKKKKKFCAVVHARPVVFDHQGAGFFTLLLRFKSVTHKSV